MKQPNKKILKDRYLAKNLSVRQIAQEVGYSESGINYLLKKYKIPKRSISEAVYIKHNPDGDPFKVLKFNADYQSFLYGLGLGLYWGEGNKNNKFSVRLGNTDPGVIKKFIEFLEKIYHVKKSKLRFGLQIFSDMPPVQALQFWVKELGASKAQFQKVVITPARSIGTYRNKTKHGVLTVYFNNKKLRDIICGMIEKIKKM